MRAQEGRYPAVIRMLNGRQNDLKSTLDFNAPTGTVKAVPPLLCKLTPKWQFWISCYTLTTTQSGRVAPLNGFPRVGVDRRLSLPNVRTLIPWLSALEKSCWLCLARTLQAREAS